MTDAEHLARRVETEEPSEELRDAVLVWFGWETPKTKFEFWSRPDGSPCHIRWLPNPLTNRDASAEIMPPGFKTNLDELTDGWFVFVYSQEGKGTVTAEAPTEPRARTAAAIRAKGMGSE